MKLSIVSVIISNGYMIHCGIGGWGKFIDSMNVIDLRYLAIKTTKGWSIPITYIVFLTEMQKGKSSEMDLPLLKNDITGFESVSKIKIYCRNMQFSSKNWDGWYHRFFEPLILVDMLELSKVLNN